MCSLSRFLKRFSSVFEYPQTRYKIHYDVFHLLGANFVLRWKKLFFSNALTTTILKNLFELMFWDLGSKLLYVLLNVNMIDDDQKTWKIPIHIMNTTFTTQNLNPCLIIENISNCIIKLGRTISIQNKWLINKLDIFVFMHSMLYFFFTTTVQRNISFKYISFNYEKILN